MQVSNLMTNPSSDVASTSQITTQSRNQAVVNELQNVLAQKKQGNRSDQGPSASR